MSGSRLVVGFIPLLDCASLVAAAEVGFATGEGLDLALIRETSWANIRDRTIVGQFDAAHMLGPMTVASTLGIGHLSVPLIAPIALGLGGNAITVSTTLWQQMAQMGAGPGSGPAIQGKALQRVVAARAREQVAPLTFAMVYPFSCHNFELRYWLAAVGIDPDNDVRLVVLPPPLLVDALRAGQIDGFCVGEPWNSLAIEAGAGCIVNPTTAIWRWSPEKVLGCRAAWAERHPEQLAALVRALFRASLWCEEPSNHAEVARMLARPRYVGAPAEILHRALAGRLAALPGASPTAMPDFYVPSRQAATFPWISHALWFYTQMVRWRQVAFASEHLAAVRSTYRPDLYRAALHPLGVDVPTIDCRIEGAGDAPSVFDGDGFFDARVYDPADLRGYLASLPQFDTHARS